MHFYVNKTITKPNKQNNWLSTLLFTHPTNWSPQRACAGRKVTTWNLSQPFLICKEAASPGLQSSFLWREFHRRFTPARLYKCNQTLLSTPGWLALSHLAPLFKPAPPQLMHWVELSPDAGRQLGKVTQTLACWVSPPRRLLINWLLCASPASRRDKWPQATEINDLVTQQINPSRDLIIIILMFLKARKMLRRLDGSFCDLLTESVAGPGWAWVVTSTCPRDSRDGRWELWDQFLHCRPSQMCSHQRVSHIHCWLKEATWGHRRRKEPGSQQTNALGARGVSMNFYTLLVLVPWANHHQFSPRDWHGVFLNYT